MEKEKVKKADSMMEDKKLKSRRKLIKAMGITAVSMAASSVLPTSWTKPLIEFGAVPAHAQFSPGAYDFNLEGEVEPGGGSVVLIARITPTPPTGSRVTLNLLRIDPVGNEEVVAGGVDVEINETGIAEFGPFPLDGGFDYRADADLLALDAEGVFLPPITETWNL